MVKAMVIMAIMGLWVLSMLMLAWGHSVLASRTRKNVEINFYISGLIATYIYLIRHLFLDHHT